MPNRDLTWKLGVQDNASSGFSKVADNAESAWNKVGSAFSKVGSQIGGEVGDLVSKVGEGFDKIGEAGTGAWTKLAAGGAVVAGLGVAFQSFAAKGQQAEAQLKVAVENAGDSFDEYEKQISSAESSGAKFGDTNTEVANALQILVQATGDTAYSIQILSVAYDLAAAKHESLNDAVTQLAKIYNGSGGKILKSLGIDATVTAGNMLEAKAAIQQVATATQGQAAASVDNFNGKVNEAKAIVENLAEKVAAFAGGPMTYVGTAATIAGTAIAWFQYRTERATLAQAELATAEDVQGGAATKAAASDLVLAAAEDKAAASGGRAALAARGIGAGLLGSLGPLAAAGAAIGALGVGMDYLQGKISSILGGAKTNQGGNKSWWDTVTGFFSTDTGSSKQLGSFIDSTGQASGAAGTVTDATNQAADANSKLDASARAVTATYASLADGFDAVVPPIKSAGDAMKTLMGAGEGLARSQDDVQLSLNNLKDSLDDHSRALTGNTTGAIDNRNAIRDQIDKINELTTAQLNAGVPLAQVTQATDANKAALLRTATQMGLNKQATQELIDKYAAVPSNVSTTMDLDTTEARTKLDSYLSLLAHAGQMGLGSTFSSQLGTAAGYRGATTVVKASGGQLGFAAAGAQLGTWVGEYGPEFINSTGYVYPHGQSMQMARANAGATIHNHYYNVTMPTVVAPSAADGARVMAALELAANSGKTMNVSKAIK